MDLRAWISQPKEGLLSLLNARAGWDKTLKMSYLRKATDRPDGHAIWLNPRIH